MWTVVTSVGTSAAKPGVPLASWVASEGRDAAVQRLLQTFAEVEPVGDALQQRLSAEIHSLVRIGPQQIARVILLSSDTDLGECCAQAVAGYLKKYFEHLELRCQRVVGLQVDDAHRFRTQGALNYCRSCLDAVHNYGRESVLINPTGGFKALVPYAVLVGMLKGVRCRYVFERSSTLLELPPLPITWNQTLLETHKVLFEELERESALPISRWQQLPHAERAQLEALVELEGDEFTLSGVGLLFAEELLRPTSRVVFLSQQAWKECLRNVGQLAGRDPFAYLARIAASNEALQKATHILTEHGLRWLKPGNTTDRYLVSVEGWRLLVWRVIREDQVGSDYAAQVVVKPETERAQYQPFTRMEFAD